MSESDTFAEQARPASSQRTPDEVRAQLQQWFAAREPGAEVVDLTMPEGNGMSSETLLATVRFGDDEQHLVIRVAPRPESDPVFPRYDLPAQFALMRHVRSYGVPAPSCLWVEEDPAVIGAPFLVMERVDGDVPPDVMPYRGNTPVAVPDWEMATVGPCELDLGWFAYLHRFFQDLAELAGLPGLPGFLRREDVERRYAERTGHVPREMDFYTAYAAIVHGVIMYRIQTRAIDFGAAAPPENPDDMILHRARIEKMLDGSYWAGVP